MKDDRKTPARLPAACGYLKMDTTWVAEAEFDGALLYVVVALSVLKMWIIPRPHMRPLNMETTHKAVKWSLWLNMWYVKEDMIAAPKQPAAVE